MQSTCGLGPECECTADEDEEEEEEEDVGDTSWVPYLLGGVAEGRGAGDGPDRFRDSIGGGEFIDPDECIGDAVG